MRNAHTQPTPATQFGSYLLSICVAAAEIWAHGRGKSPLAASTHRAVDPPAGGEEKNAVSSDFSDFKRFQTGFKRFQAVSADDLLARPTLAPYSLSSPEAQGRFKDLNVGFS